MKKIIPLVCVLLLLCAVFGAAAESAELAVTAPADEIRPGRPSIITVNAPADGTCSIYLQDEDGAMVCFVAENRAVTAGYNSLYWNGTDAGLPAPTGEWSPAAMLPESSSVPPERVVPPVWELAGLSVTVPGPAISTAVSPVKS